jgi:hypothetical protein
LGTTRRASTLAAACADDDTFVGDHIVEIRYDCEQTVQCLAARGNSLSAQPIDDCLSSSKAEISGFSDSQRDAWEARFDRCAPFQNCDYYDCTQADTAYSTARAAQIQYDCMARIACRVSRGEMLPATAQDQCASEISVTLDIADAAKRTAFEARFARCSMMQGCAYADCQ